MITESGTSWWFLLEKPMIVGYPGYPNSETYPAPSIFERHQDLRACCYENGNLTVDRAQCECHSFLITAGSSSGLSGGICLGITYGNITVCMWHVDAWWEKSKMIFNGFQWEISGWYVKIPLFAFSFPVILHLGIILIFYHLSQNRMKKNPRENHGFQYSSRTRERERILLDQSSG